MRPSPSHPLGDALGLILRSSRHLHRSREPTRSMNHNVSERASYIDARADALRLHSGHSRPFLSVPREPPNRSWLQHERCEPATRVLPRLPGIM